MSNRSVKLALLIASYLSTLFFGATVIVATFLVGGAELGGLLGLYAFVPCLLASILANWLLTKWYNKAPKSK